MIFPSELISKQQRSETDPSPFYSGLKRALDVVLSAIGLLILLPVFTILADAIKNVQKYAQKEGFVNLQGGQNQEFGPFINFDSKGVEFGPWIARFVAQVRRNWFIPMAAMTMRDTATPCQAASCSRRQW